MRVVLQRVSSASVAVEGEAVAEIGSGLLLLVGAAEGDSEDDARQLARKCAEMRIFPDDQGRFDRSVLDTGGEALVVSQFTLIAEVRKGRRPSFVGAARPEAAEPLIDAFTEELRSLGIPAETGEFGATMDVAMVNEGPVTVVVDSEVFERPRKG
jgi:D-tyrosyl-tRNA(Tyr) deacylase